MEKKENMDNSFAFSSQDRVRNARMCYAPDLPQLAFIHPVTEPPSPLHSQTFELIFTTFNSSLSGYTE